MKILFRVDATISAGSGHMSRCLALAEEFMVKGNEVVFMGFFEEIPWIKKRISKLGVLFISISRAQIPESLINDISPDVIVFDSYEFDIELVNSISRKFFTITLVDSHYTKIFANIYLNQNLGAEEVNFESPNNLSSKLFLGSKYALIRESLLQVRNEYQLRTPKQPVVTCFLGGSKSSNKVYELSEFLAKLDKGPKFNFVVDESQILQISKNMKKHDLTFYIPSPNLDRILLSSDSIICGAGSSVLEMHCVGIPTAYIPVADNQLTSLKRIKDRQSGILLTEHHKDSIDVRKIDELNELLYNNDIRISIFNKSKMIVDGMGKKRLVESVLD